MEKTRMSLDEITQTYLPAVEIELHQVVEQVNGAGLEGLYGMLAYHLGWVGEGAYPPVSGKRIRPLLVLLSASAAGGEWRRALPAAAAVELVHNFSLIHDDIQDNSPLRRRRPTVWKLWGVPQGINAGDAMFSLAHLALLRSISRGASPVTTIQAIQVLDEACLQLTQGQYLDISYETRSDLTQESYWPMVNGKTGALLSACTWLGAIIAEADRSRQAAFRQFGRLLGLAFQAQDDLLGVWGDAALMGKSTESDLVTGKKSLPILYGLEKGGGFAKRWKQGPITASEAQDLARQLEEEGARAFTMAKVEELTAQSLAALDQAQPQAEAGEALRQLALRLVQRQA